MPRPFPLSQVLLSRGALVAAVDSRGHTALAYALTLDKRETLECARVLLACGARPLMPGNNELKWPEGEHMLDITGESWVHRAVRYGAGGCVL